MNVNLHLKGELEKFVNGLVKRGLAANKTEAIRLAIVKYYEQEKRKKEDMGLDMTMQQQAMKEVWDNPSDDKAEKFYVKKYLQKGKGGKTRR
jgi:Arc/MetJ-type ribon-helix-helix transcriptional regulator